VVIVERVFAFVLAAATIVLFLALWFQEDE
jgi:hypothetical protein